MIDQFDVIVIGGGQAGLASGYHLQRRGIRFIILESQPLAVGSWPHYYESLKLFSPAELSSLPGMKFPGQSDRYPLRDEVIQYFKHYKENFKLPVETNQRVAKVLKEDGYFSVYTAEGKVFRSKAVINASGNFRNPYTPVIPGQELYEGRTLHSSAYRSPEAFEGQRVVVVGRGNSAVQIAVELAENCNTSLAVQSPVQFVKQLLLGKDAHYWLRRTGFDTFPFWRVGLSAPNPGSVIDLDRYRERLESGKPYQQQMFTAFSKDGVVWPDGVSERVDSVIWATGYRPGLEHLNALKALDQEGRPLHQAGVSISEPGLYYVGLYGQQSFASATIRGVGGDARYVIRKLLRHIQKF
ncbi:NAD(P)-binding domain-containing protein [Paenibacillus nasutitermitis]|uniref:Monooxygenase n=1 Tax=Paenibacillus nasutitermitis TaxID=1652958 RepID=A0A916YU08_9BACL|nr:NAD(P)-binding domain-containing protein [Paenibacillus nasutitermitis]GGD61066.1 monooxygenase [Paenibacillus nasutitermitis]